MYCVEMLNDDKLQGINNTAVVYNLPGALFSYYENFLSKELADFYFETFQLLPFTQGTVRGGVEKRLSCFFSDLHNPDGTVRDYYYSGKVNKPLEFNDEMRTLKDSVEAATGYRFNSCLINLYNTGKNVIGWHSDSEKSIVPESAIASISLGAERWFDVCAKDNAPEYREESIRTKHGSMMIMAGTMQKYYKHQIRQEASVKAPRINLTFRLAR